MAEVDIFEARFAAAYRRYLDEAPTEVDAAAVARAAALQPRTRRLVLPWTLRSIPALAWLVLLGLVVTSLLAAILVIGSQRPAVVGYTCPPGSNPDKPGPVDQARPWDGAHLSMAFDRRAGRLLAVVGVDDAVETWTFDVCTNTWTRMHPDQEPFGWLELAYDNGSGLTIGVTSCRDCVTDPHGVTWAYSLQANTWTNVGAAPTDVTALFYDPIDGRLFGLGDEGDHPYTSPPELWSYGVESSTWTPMRQVGELGPGALVTYDASVDRIVAYGSTVDPESVDRAVRLFDIRTGEWSWAGAVTPGIWGAGWWGAPPAVAYDEAAQRTAVFGDGLAAYDATADRWEVLIDPTDRDPSDWLPSSMVYDPVNRRLVGLGRGVVVDRGGVAAFDLVAREWTVLLEPIPGQHAP